MEQCGTVTEQCVTAAVQPWCIDVLVLGLSEGCVSSCVIQQKRVPCLGRIRNSWLFSPTLWPILHCCERILCSTHVKHENFNIFSTSSLLFSYNESHTRPRQFISILQANANAHQAIHINIADRHEDTSNTLTETTRKYKLQFHELSTQL